MKLIRSTAARHTSEVSSIDVTNQSHHLGESMIQLSAQCIACVRRSLHDLKPRSLSTCRAWTASATSDVGRSAFTDSIREP